MDLASGRVVDDPDGTDGGQAPSRSPTERRPRRGSARRIPAARSMGSARTTSTCRSISARGNSRRRPSSSAISCCGRTCARRTGRVPLFGIVSRLTSQKGFDLLTDTLPKLLQNHDVRLAVVGTRRREVREVLRGLAERHRGPRVVLRRLRRSAGALDRRRQRRVPHALAVRALRAQPDVLACVTARFPIVRRTGGLADSVTHFDPATGAGTGIVFNDFDATAMSWALDTAMQWYAQPALWERIVQNAMRRDFSWETQANEYLKLFAELLQLDAAALIKGNAPQKAAG